MLWNFTPVFEEMNVLRREMDAMFDRTQRSLAGSGTQFPALNLYQDEDALYVLAALPGLVKQDIELIYADQTLTLKGEQKSPFQPDEQMIPLRQERRLGQFEKSVRIPMDVDVEHIHAELKEGLLSVRLPKASRAKTRQIEIQ